MTSVQDQLPRLDLGLADLARDHDLVLCDVWGVIHNGVTAYRSAVDALQSFRKGGGTVVLVTNAPAPKAQVIRRLDSLQVPRDAYDDVATSGDVAVATIVEAGCPPIFNIGPSAEIALYREAAKHCGRPLRLTPIETAELAICIAPDETGERPEDYDATLLRLYARDIEMICANPDIVVEMGHELVWCAGAIAERYAAMGGRVTQAGKPFPAIYQRAFAMAGTLRGGDVDPSRTLAIGDALATDMAGARNQEIAALLVTGGIHRAELHDGETIDPVSLRATLARTGVRPTAALPLLVWER